jgi:hypothetical protein
MKSTVQSQTLEIAAIVAIARNPSLRKARTLPLINADNTDSHGFSAMAALFKRREFATDDIFAYSSVITADLRESVDQHYQR